MQIGTLSTRTGLSRDSLRFYEKRGLLQARRSDNGYRDYPEEAVQWLGYVRTAQQLGFTLAEIAADMPLVKTDHALLEQALANVLHNAAVHTPEGTPVELSGARRAKHKEFTGRDHGTGLAPGEERRIFGKFYRSPGAPAGGTGLGLSITKGFLRALGGEIVARNHPAGGAEFTLRLHAETMEPASVTEA